MELEASANVKKWQCILLMTGDGQGKLVPVCSAPALSSWTFCPFPVCLVNIFVLIHATVDSRIWTGCCCWGIVVSYWLHVVAAFKNKSAHLLPMKWLFTKIWTVNKYVECNNSVMLQKAMNVCVLFLDNRSVGTFARALDCTSTVRQPSLHISAAAASRDITLVIISIELLLLLLSFSGKLLVV